MQDKIALLGVGGCQGRGSLPVFVITFIETLNEMKEKAEKRA